MIRTSPKNLAVFIAREKGGRWAVINGDQIYQANRDGEWRKQRVLVDRNGANATHRPRGWSVKKQMPPFGFWLSKDADTKKELLELLDKAITKEWRF